MAETEAGAGAVSFHPDDRDRFRGAPWWRASERVAATGRGPAHGAGRLAVKIAVLDLLGVQPRNEVLAEVEVLPRPRVACSGGPACPLGHPPVVRLCEGLARRFPGVSLTASISHSTAWAVAVAVRDVHPLAPVVGGEVA